MADPDLRELLLVLIQLAAAFLKAHMKRARGVAAFCARIRARLEKLHARHATLAGMNLEELDAMARRLNEEREAFCGEDYLARNFPVMEPE